jgi:hypothetical protein
MVRLITDTDTSDLACRQTPSLGPVQFTVTQSQPSQPVNHSARPSNTCFGVRVWFEMT